MKAQEIFDRTAKHLIDQGCPARAPGGSGCRYRGANGTVCSVGLWITDKMYLPEMEDQSVDILLASGKYKLPAWFKKHALLLASLQSAHDDLPLDVWAEHIKAALANVANIYGLVCNF